MVGRPSGFTQEIADTICDRLMAGESLRGICRDDDTPTLSTVMKWLNDRQDFSEQYARAKSVQADLMAEEIFDIADDDSEDVQRSRLRVDARKWLMGKMKPQKYSDKTRLEHSGGIRDMTGVSDEQLARIATGGGADTAEPEGGAA